MRTVMWKMTKLSMLTTLLLIVVLGGAPPATIKQAPALIPSVLKVCLGCTYSSIQTAVDVARPGDTIEVYPPFLNPWPFSFYNPTLLDKARNFVALLGQPAWVENVVISKALTLEAKPGIAKEVSLVPFSGGTPVFDITAEEGQVTIRGFSVWSNFSIRWNGKADLILERNRFQQKEPDPYKVNIELNGGSGQAQLADNQIEGTVVINGARVNLISNRLKSLLLISGMVKPSERESEVILTQNFIEGSIHIEAGSRAHLEQNLLIGGGGSNPVGLDSLDIGLLLETGVQEDGQVWLWPIIVEANQNIIVRYSKGVAIGYNCDDTTTAKVLQLSGMDNLIEQNQQNLCPADYPWPPGFRK